MKFTQKQTKIKETDINQLTKHHIVRVLATFEQNFPITEEMKNIIKKEFWFFNQNIKKRLFDNELIYLNEKKHPWHPYQNENKENDK